MVPSSGTPDMKASFTWGLFPSGNISNVCLRVGSSDTHPPGKAGSFVPENMGPLEEGLELVRSREQAKRKGGRFWQHKGQGAKVGPQQGTSEPSRKVEGLRGFSGGTVCHEGAHGVLRAGGGIPVADP